MKKTIALLLLILFTGCVQENELDAPEQNLADVKVEVIHFHGNSQCTSCIALGRYAEDTVNEYFQEELASGKLTFRHVNYDLPENRELAERYGVTGSSLWIGTYSGDDFSAEQNIDVWYKLNDREGYMAYLREVIAGKLG